jgi:predicted acyltransferase
MLVQRREYRRNPRGALTRSHHLASLDAFRGLTVAGMILVNNPGNWNSTFESLTHAEWNGCTLADLVFPFFIFILGAAIPFAFSRRIGRGEHRRDLYMRIGRRTAWLIALGLILNLVAALPAMAAVRIPGVLQRIGLVYLIAAILVLELDSRWRAAILVVLVLGHWWLLRAVPFDGRAAGLTPSHNLAGFIDKAVFGSHVLTPSNDPEGLLGTLTAVGTALIGSIAGEWLLPSLGTRPRLGHLVAGGSVALIVGSIWALTWPLNKSLWTGSFVMWTGGLAALMLAACYLVLDVLDYRRWATPFLWLGFNPLAIYFLSELARDLADKPWLRVSGQTLTVRSWVFWDIVRPAIPRIGDEWISFFVAMATVTFWIFVAGVLYRRGVRLHV